MKDAQISRYFDTKYMTVLLIEIFLQNLPIFLHRTGQFLCDIRHVAY